MNIDPSTTKYMIRAKINADGIIEKPDVVGAVFGQTEGLLGDELDLRDLQKSGRIGRIEVEVTSKSGKSEGLVYVSSSLDQVETVILASALETVDRVGPCKASIHILGIEDVRISKRERVVERAKELLSELVKQSKGSSFDLTDSVRRSVQIEEITTYGKDKCPAGPTVKDSESIIIVEGRSDVLNLLKAGIKNTIAVEGTNIPKTVQDLSKERITTAFVDGDRGGELILRELFQVAEIDFIVRAPRAHEVEELTAKQIIKCLRNKMSGDQYMEMNGLIDERSIEDTSDSIEPSNIYEEKHDYKDKHENHDEDHEDKHTHYKKERDDRHSDHKEHYDIDSVEKYKRKHNEESKECGSIEIVDKECPHIYDSDALTISGSSDIKSAEQIDEKVERQRRDTKTRSTRGNKFIDKVLTPEQEQYRDMLLDLSTTHNAKVLGKDNTLIREVAVKNLVNSLKEDPSDISAIVFDGVISQRILDISSKKSINIIVGTRKGNITKMPADITIWTKDDLY